MDTKIYIADTTPLLNEDYYNNAVNKLPAWRKEKAARYKSASGRATSAGAFLLLMHALESQGLYIPELEFIYGEHKKPYLKDHDDIYFNLSHSGSRVMCIIGDSENGCDVQNIEKSGDKIAARFFSENENAYLSSIREEDLRRLAFHKIWCIKESYLKALGTGLSKNLKSFEVDLEKERITPQDPRFTVKIYDAGPGYVCSAAAAVLPEDIEVYRF